MTDCESCNLYGNALRSHCKGNDGILSIEYCDYVITFHLHGDEVDVHYEMIPQYIGEVFYIELPSNEDVDGDLSNGFSTSMNFTQLVTVIAHRLRLTNLMNGYYTDSHEKTVPDHECQYRGVDGFGILSRSVLINELS